MKITSSCFDSKTKVFDTNHDYPKLFRSDTIEEDFPANVHKFWKCPKCGSLLFFEDEGNVSIFVPLEQANSGSSADNIETGVIYDDYSWDALTEASIADKDITEKFPPSLSMQLSNNQCMIVDQCGNKTFFHRL